MEDGDFNMFSMCMNILQGLLRVFFGGKIHKDHSNQEKFSVPVSPLNVELPNILFNNKDMESDSYKQLQKLVQAGLQQEEW